MIKTITIDGVNYEIMSMNTDERGGISIEIYVHTAEQAEGIGQLFEAAKQNKQVAVYANHEELSQMVDIVAITSCINREQPDKNDHGQVTFLLNWDDPCLS